MAYEILCLIKERIINTIVTEKNLVASIIEMVEIEYLFRWFKHV